MVNLSALKPQGLQVMAAPPEGLELVPGIGRTREEAIQAAAIKPARVFANETPYPWNFSGAYASSEWELAKEGQHGKPSPRPSPQLRRLDRDPSVLAAEV